MLLAEALLALLIAILLSLVLVGLFGWRHPGRIGLLPSILFLVFVLFAATWAGGAWVSKTGPHVSDIYWIPFVIVGIVLALLIGILIPPLQKPLKRSEELRQVEARREGTALIGAFLAVLLIALLVIAVIRYV